MGPNNFLFQALVYLASAVIFVPIAKRLGLGSVLGYLLAGVVIGPFVFGFIGEEGKDIMHYAEFGVVMMLFLIGLELEPQLLWRLRKSIMGLGSLQVVVTALMVGVIVYLLGLNWQQSLASGLIMAMSSTAIVMQSMKEKGLMKTEAGQSSFSVLLFQDIAVIPILALFPLLANIAVTESAEAGHGTTWVEGQPAWVHTLIVLVSVAGIILIGRILLRPLLRIVAKTGLREVFTASALLIVVGIAALMTQVGLSPALGAFLAGVVLANSEYRHELESDIDPFKGLLLGNLLGIGLAWLQMHYGFFKLDQSSYYLDSVPIELVFRDILLINMGSFVICLLILILPAKFVSKIKPVKSIKFN